MELAGSFRRAFAQRFSSALLALVAASVVGLAGCGEPEKGSASEPGSGNSAASANAPIKIAFVPSEDAEKMVEGFEPMRVQLAKDLGREVEVLKVTDYGSVIEAMRSDKIDLAWYGPLSMILANQEAGSEPFAIPDIEGKGLGYHSMFIVKANSPAKSVADLKGKKCAFVDPGSTSGNLVPRAHLMQEFKSKAEDFFSEITYAGSHDAAFLAMMNGAVDACAIQDITLTSAIDKKQATMNDVRVLWTSENLPPSPLAVRKGFDPVLLAKIVSSFENMHKVVPPTDVPGMGTVKRFVKTDMKTFQPIADMAKSLGMTAKELGK